MIQLETFVCAVLLAVGAAFLNHHYWKKIGFWWHTIQWIILAAISYFVAVELFHEYTVAMLAWSSIHWLVFEAVLYKLRGLPLLYVGKTASTDKVFQALGKFFWRSSSGGSPEALAKNIKIWVKWTYMIASLALYSVICNC